MPFPTTPRPHPIWRSLLTLTAFVVITLTTKAQPEPPAIPQLPDLPWQQRSDWINVRTAGAKGDGVTDDTDAIQSVLDHLRDKPPAGQPRQRVVYFPPGRYRITRTLVIAESTGDWLVGHGRSTVLLWDGEPGGRLLWSNGCRYVCYEGLTLDGQGRAGTLIGHQSQFYYETWVRYRHCAFLNARDYGVVVGQGEAKSPSAEINFFNCLFAHCGQGAGFLAPNDYDNIFDGCEFDQCGIGIHGIRGNWQIRGCRFEGSQIADLKQDNISHGASVRFCVSRGSRRFLETCRDANPMPIQIEGCRIENWSAPDGAIVLGHPGPFTLFDCVFAHAPNDAPPVVLIGPDNFSQSLIESSNALPPGTTTLVKTNPKAVVTSIPAGHRPPVVPSLEQKFFHSEARIPGKVFDAVTDFGAKADGKTDAADAIQKCLDAARQSGHDAIAYLPAGDYLLSHTLSVTGTDYFLGGMGTPTRLHWSGPAGGVAIHIDTPQRVVLEDFAFGPPKDDSYTRLRQTATGTGPSSVLYDQIETNHWNEDPVDGLVCENLPETARVRFGLFNGKLRLHDCGPADIFAFIHYGPAAIEGADRPKTGFTGFMFHNAALSSPGAPLYALTVTDNQDLVVADYYMEQSQRYLLCEGGKRPGTGHVTIGASKISTKDVQSVTIRNYEGRIWISGGDAQSDIDNQKTLHLFQEGPRPVTLLSVGNSWCEYQPILDLTPAATFIRLGDVLRGEHRGPLANQVPAGGLEAAAAALDDFRQLGAVYLEEIAGGRR